MPPAAHTALVQLVGNTSNSAEPGAFASCTSPSPTAVMAMFASGVPSVKSACSVSVKVPAAAVTKSRVPGARAANRLASRPTPSATPALGVSRLPLSSTARERIT